MVQNNCCVECCVCGKWFWTFLAPCLLVHVVSEECPQCETLPINPNASSWGSIGKFHFRVSVIRLPTPRTHTSSITHSISYYDSPFFTNPPSIRTQQLVTLLTQHPHHQHDQQRQRQQNLCRLRSRKGTKGSADDGPFQCGVCGNLPKSRSMHEAASRTNHTVSTTVGRLSNLSREKSKQWNYR